MKTMFVAALALAGMAFALTACDSGSSGGTGTPKPKAEIVNANARNECPKDYTYSAADDKCHLNHPPA